MKYLILLLFTFFVVLFYGCTSGSDEMDLKYTATIAKDISGSCSIGRSSASLTYVMESEKPFDYVAFDAEKLWASLNSIGPYDKTIEFPMVREGEGKTKYSEVLIGGADFYGFWISNNTEDVVMRANAPISCE